MRQARCVIRLRPAQRLVKIYAMAGLVAHRIDQHAGEVFVADDHSPDAVKNRRTKGRIIRDAVIRPFDIPGRQRNDPVALDVGLVQHIKAQFLTQLIKNGRLRIMAGANGVDVVPLHHQQVMKHYFPVHDRARIRMAFVQIDAF